MLAGVATLPIIAIVLDVLTTDKLLASFNITHKAQKMRKKCMQFAKCTLENRVLILLVIDFGKYITSHGLETLCNCPETPSQWKYESEFGNITTDEMSQVITSLTIMTIITR